MRGQPSRAHQKPCSAFGNRLFADVYASFRGFKCWANRIVESKACRGDASNAHDSVQRVALMRDAVFWAFMHRTRTRGGEAGSEFRVQGEPTHEYFFWTIL